MTYSVEGVTILKKWQTKAGRGLSYRLYRTRSKYHRLLWVTSYYLMKALVTVLNLLDRFRGRVYTKISLEDLYVEDFPAQEYRIPLKWSSGASEVVRLPRGARKFTFKVWKGFKIA